MSKALMGVATGVAVAIVVGLLPMGVSAADPPVYKQRELVGANDVMKSTGLVFCKGYLYSSDTLRNSIFRIDPITGKVDRIATDHDRLDQVLFSPHTLAVWNERLFVTEYTTKEVTRLGEDCNAQDRTTIATGITDPATSDRRGGVTSPAGIAFTSQGRLFVTDSVHDPSRPGGLWEVDPAGNDQPELIARGLGLAQLIAFHPDRRPHLAYVADTYGDKVHVVDVETGEIFDKPELAGFEQAFGVAFRDDELLVATLAGDVWSVDLSSGNRELLARTDRVGLTALAVADDGTIYVSNGLIGGVFRVNEVTGKLDPAVTVGEFAVPTSLSEAAPGTTLPSGAALPVGSLWVADGSSLSTVAPGGRVDHLSNFLFSRNGSTTEHLLTLGVLQADPDTVYFAEAFPLLDQRLSVLDPASPDGSRILHHFENVVDEFNPLPYHIRSGPPGHLLVSLQTLTTGSVVDVDLSSCDAVTETCAVRTVIDGLRAPGGLAYDPETNLAYVSETESGVIWEVALESGVRSVVASGLDVPEGLDLDGRGGLVVVEGGGSRRLLRVELKGQGQTVLASRLATHVRGPAPQPFGIELLSDVLVRDDESIVVSTLEDSRLLVFDPTGRTN